MGEDLQGRLFWTSRLLSLLLDTSGGRSTLVLLSTARGQNSALNQRDIMMFYVFLTPPAATIVLKTQAMTASALFHYFSFFSSQLIQMFPKSIYCIKFTVDYGLNQTPRRCNAIIIIIIIFKI